MEGEKNKKITDTEEEIPVLSSMNNPNDDSIANDDSLDNVIAIDDENNGEDKEDKPDDDLPDGFFAVESILRKRVHKARQVQYLIKWQGWPESASTWEPIENLESCLGLVDAFEKRSSRSRKHNSGKRELKQQPHAQAQSRKKALKHSAAAGCPVVVPFADSEDEEPATDMPETTEQQSIRTGPGNDSSELQEIKGVKRRKSGSVKRFIKESALSDLNDTQDERTRIDIDTILRSLSDENKTANWEKDYTVTEIIESVSYSTSATDFQGVLVKFKATRSDGKVVVVDNKYLKANNPILLINFYEQKLRTIYQLEQF